MYTDYQPTDITDWESTHPLTFYMAFDEHLRDKKGFTFSIGRVYSCKSFSSFPDALYYSFASSSPVGVACYYENPRICEVQPYAGITTFKDKDNPSGRTLYALYAFKILREVPHEELIGLLERDRAKLEDFIKLRATYNEILERAPLYSGAFTQSSCKRLLRSPHLNSEQKFDILPVIYKPLVFIHEEKWDEYIQRVIENKADFLQILSDFPLSFPETVLSNTALLDLQEQLLDAHDSVSVMEKLHKLMESVKDDAENDSMKKQPNWPALHAILQSSLAAINRIEVLRDMYMAKFEGPDFYSSYKLKYTISGGEVLPVLVEDGQDDTKFFPGNLFRAEETFGVFDTEEECKNVLLTMRAFRYTAMYSIPFRPGAWCLSRRNGELHFNQVQEEAVGALYFESKAALEDAVHNMTDQFGTDGITLMFDILTKITTPAFWDKY